MSLDLNLRRAISLGILFAFLANALGPIPAHAQTASNLPAPGTMVNLSPAYEPVLIKGLKVHPENPFLFDFIIDTGSNSLPKSLSSPENSKVSSPNVSVGDLKQESTKLIKYFLAAMTVPEKDLWVNLSPYEKDRMINPNLGQTEMGRDMLAQDYILKQLTASLIYPERNLGKKFWDEVYTKAQEQYGTTQIPVNTFNKVWIIADKADVFERGNTAYIVGAHLKVMLEEDYLALQKNTSTRGHGPSAEGGRSVSPSTLPSNEALNVKATQRQPNAIASQIIRQIILPQIEREVNQGKNFAPLRQMFYSMILASWYKMALKDAILAQIYGNKSKVKGLGYKNIVIANSSPVIASEAKQSQSIDDKDAIFQRYLQAYKKGVFNYIKEDVDQTTQQPTPRKYFSGGFDMAMLQTQIQRLKNPTLLSEDAFVTKGSVIDAAVAINTVLPTLDKAMTTETLPVVDSFEQALELVKGHPKRNYMQVIDSEAQGITSYKGINDPQKIEKIFKTRKLQKSPLAWAGGPRRPMFMAINPFQFNSSGMILELSGETLENYYGVKSSSSYIEDDVWLYHVKRAWIVLADGVDDFNKDEVRISELVIPGMASALEAMVNNKMPLPRIVDEAVYDMRLEYNRLTWIFSAQKRDNLQGPPMSQWIPQEVSDPVDKIESTLDQLQIALTEGGFTEKEKSKYWYDLRGYRQGLQKLMTYLPKVPLVKIDPDRQRLLLTDNAPIKRMIAIAKLVEQALHPETIDNDAAIMAASIPDHKALLAALSEYSFTLTAFAGAISVAYKIIQWEIEEKQALESYRRTLRKYFNSLSSDDNGLKIITEEEKNLGREESIKTLHLLGYTEEEIATILKNTAYKIIGKDHELYLKEQRMIDLIYPRDAAMLGFWTYRLKKEFGILELGGLFNGRDRYSLSGKQLWDVNHRMVIGKPIAEEGHVFQLVNEKASRIIKIGKYFNKYTLNEIRMLLQLHQKGVEGIPRVTQIGLNVDGKIWVMMDGLKNGESLAHHVFSNPVKTLDAMVKAANILREVHDQSVAHNDIKPENFLVDPLGEIELIDFEFATPFGAYFRYGTEDYLPNERTRGEKTDVFSFILTIKVLLDTIHHRILRKDPQKAALLAGLSKKYLRMIYSEIQEGYDIKLRKKIFDGIYYTERPAQEWPTMDALIAQLELDEKNLSKEFAIEKLVPHAIQSDVVALNDHAMSVKSQYKAIMTDVMVYFVRKHWIKATDQYLKDYFNKIADATLSERDRFSQLLEMGKGFQLNSYINDFFYYYEKSRETSPDSIDRFIDLVFKKAQGDPSTRIVFLKAGAQPLYQAAIIRALVTKGFPVERIHSVWGTMGQYRHMQEDPKQKELFIRYLQQEGILNADTNHILFVDTDVFATLGTQYLIGMTLLDQDVMSHTTGIPLSWNRQGGNYQAEMVVMLAQEHFLAHNERESIPVSSLTTSNMSKSWLTIDHMQKLYSIENKFSPMEEDGEIHVEAAPAYYGKKDIMDGSSPQEIGLTNTFQYAGLLMGVLDNLEKEGYDVSGVWNQYKNWLKRRLKDISAWKEDYWKQGEELDKFDIDTDDAMKVSRASSQDKAMITVIEYPAKADLNYFVDAINTYLNKNPKEFSDAMQSVLLTIGQRVRISGSWTDLFYALNLKRPQYKFSVADIASALEKCIKSNAYQKKLEPQTSESFNLILQEIENRGTQHDLWERTRSDLKKDHYLRSSTAQELFLNMIFIIDKNQGEIINAVQGVEIPPEVARATNAYRRQLIWAKANQPKWAKSILKPERLAFIEILKKNKVSQVIGGDLFKRHILYSGDNFEKQEVAEFDQDWAMAALLKGKNILVVDDSLAFHRLLEVALKGTNIQSAINGRDALVKMDEMKQSGNKFDLIITDLDMPEMNGEALVLEVRKMNNEMPMIMWTAGNDDKLAKLSKDLGIPVIDKEVALLMPLIERELSNANEKARDGAMTIKKRMKNIIDEWIGDILTKYHRPLKPIISAQIDRRGRYFIVLIKVERVKINDILARINFEGGLRQKLSKVFPNYEYESHILNHNEAELIFFKPTDHAMRANTGGIDLRSTTINISQSGQGVQMQFDPAIIGRIKREGFDGLEFRIQSIVPVTDLPLFLGIESVR